MRELSAHLGRSCRSDPGGSGRFAALCRIPAKPVVSPQLRGQVVLGRLDTFGPAEGDLLMFSNAKLAYDKGSLGSGRQVTRMKLENHQCIL
jgi:hypothetical protein